MCISNQQKIYSHKTTAEDEGLMVRYIQIDPDSGRVIRRFKSKGAAQRAARRMRAAGHYWEPGHPEIIPAGKLRRMRA
jgi:hypothetical protein